MTVHPLHAVKVLVLMASMASLVTVLDLATLEQHAQVTLMNARLIIRVILMPLV